MQLENSDKKCDLDIRFLRRGGFHRRQDLQSFFLSFLVVVEVLIGWRGHRFKRFRDPSAGQSSFGVSVVPISRPILILSLGGG